MSPALVLKLMLPSAESVSSFKFPVFEVSLVSPLSLEIWALISGVVGYLEVCGFGS
jgi:hypothetical protein